MGIKNVSLMPNGLLEWGGGGYAQNLPILPVLHRGPCHKMELILRSRDTMDMSRS